MNLLFPLRHIRFSVLLIASCFCLSHSAAQAQVNSKETVVVETRAGQEAIAPTPSITREPIDTAPADKTSAKASTPVSASQTNAVSKSISDWEILDEPAKLPSTPALSPANVISNSPFSSESLQSIARSKNLALPLKDARVEILKSKRRLDLYSGRTLVKSYRVSLGKNPVGHKTRQGDNRTPEGRYFICTRNSTTSDFHVFLGLSYPAVLDARRGVHQKQISWREYQLINQRLASRSAPLWETRLGGWIGIHGGTDESFAQKKMRERGSRDWTAGCIALTDAQIEEIHAATGLGTPVDIRP